MQISRTPPIIREINGVTYLVVIMDDQQEYAAAIGPWFASRFMVQIVVPQLVLKAHDDTTQPKLPGMENA